MWKVFNPLRPIVLQQYYTQIIDCFHTICQLCGIYYSFYQYIINIKIRKQYLILQWLNCYWKVERKNINLAKILFQIVQWIIKNIYLAFIFVVIRVILCIRNSLIIKLNHTCIKSRTENNIMLYIYLKNHLHYRAIMKLY